MILLVHMLVCAISKLSTLKFITEICEIAFEVIRALKDIETTKASYTLGNVTETENLCNARC